MKNIIKNRTTRGAIIWIGIVTIAVMYGCKDKFLEIPVKGQLDKNVLGNNRGVQAALISAYAQMNGRGAIVGGPSNWVYGSIRGGEANKGTDPGDFSDINPIQRYEAQSTQGVILEKWNVCYEGIARCNATLRLMAVATDMTADQTKQVEAQAKFLRAYYYFELRRNFGWTPYVDETLDVSNGIAKVKNDKETYPMIEADLDVAIAGLPDTWAEVGRANRFAAMAYKAKVFMYQNKYTEAKAMFDQLVNTDGTGKGKTSNGKTWGLVPKFADIFRASNDNHEESIFTFQGAANTGSSNNADPELVLNWPYNTGPNGPGNCCSFFQPSFEMGNSFRTSGGLPLLDKSYNTGANQLVTDMGLLSTDAFTPDAGPIDPRLDHSIGRRGIPYLDWGNFPGKDWIRNQPNAGPYQTKKMVYYKTDQGKFQDNSSWTPGYIATNIYLMRYGDVLLMAAEAEAEVGSLVNATTYVNAIRNRAANPAGFVKLADGVTNAANYVISPYPATFTDQATARTAIQFERKLELSSEGHRFYDLQRWGTASTEINAYLAYESPKLTLGAFIGAAYASEDAYLPIPQSQIDLLGKDILKQNLGF